MKFYRPDYIFIALIVIGVMLGSVKPSAWATLSRELRFYPDLLFMLLIAILVVVVLACHKEE
jgi:uncharacterized Tic20 family protein